MKFNQYFIIVLCLLVPGILLPGICAADSSIVSSETPGINDAENLLYHGIYENNGIALHDGKWSGKPFVKGGASRPTAGLIKNFTFTGDIDADGTFERVVFLWESSGGSGTRVYMAVVGFRDNKPVNLATHLVGDRVQLQMGRVNRGTIELDLVQAGKGDAACCPASKILRTWTLNNNQLIENKPQLLGRFSLLDLERVEWTLARMNWRESVVENTQITLTIKGEKVSGKSGCNRYFASIKEGEIPGDVIISQAGGTRMACPGDAMKQESRFLNALVNVNKYSFINGQLALSWKDDNATSTMLFTAQKSK